VKEVARGTTTNQLSTTNMMRKPPRNPTLPLCSNPNKTGGRRKKEERKGTRRRKGRGEEKKVGS
jgi:hypothetical protein